MSELVSWTCDCGVECGMTPEYETKLRKSHNTFYCLNGCSRHYPQDNKVEVLQKKLKSAQATSEWQRIHRTQAENSLRTTKGQVTKLEKRLAQEETT